MLRKFIVGLALVGGMALGFLGAVNATDAVPDTTVTGCLKQSIKVAVTCNPDGTYTLTLTGAPMPGIDVTLTSQTPGVIVTPPQQPWTGTATWTVTGATPGQTITLLVNATKAGGGSAEGSDLCCSGEIKVVMPSCPPVSKIDVAVTKTGFTSPPVCVNHFTYTLWPTNVGAGFSGTNNITVTDTVPIGMDFISYVGPNWSCLPMPTPGGSTVTCTYIGAGPSGPGSLGSIAFTGSATVPPPYPDYTNSAAVISLMSGLVDSNPSNNTSGSVTLHKTLPCSQPAACNPVTSQMRGGECVCRYPNMVRNAQGVCTCLDGQTFAAGRGCVKPPDVCPPPMVPGFVAGQCICPPGTVLHGTECVKQTTCQPPMVQGPVVGVCICPPGTVQKGRECVRQITCSAPKVPNAAGKECICPQGTVQKGRECVPARAQPEKPKRCPEGTAKQGSKCVKQEKPKVNITPGDVINGIGVIRGIGGRSGGGGAAAPSGGGYTPGKR